MIDETLRAEEAANLVLLSDSNERFIENVSDTDDNVSWISADSDIDDNSDDDQHRMCTIGLFLIKRLVTHMFQVYHWQLKIRMLVD